VSITTPALSKHSEPLSYRVNHAASLTGLCRSQIYNLMRDGTLPFVEVGKIRLIRADDLRRLLKMREPSGT
jgi:excisionase family DNA binding protein